jgi:hypothetical protein
MVEAVLGRLEKHPAATTVELLVLVRVTTEVRLELDQTLVAVAAVLAQ